MFYLLYLKFRLLILWFLFFYKGIFLVVLRNKKGIIWIKNEIEQEEGYHDHDERHLKMFALSGTWKTWTKFY